MKDLMKKQYSQIVASAAIQRMKHGESIAAISKELNIPKLTLWRWREGKSFPQSGISKDYHEYYEENRQKIIERLKRNKYDGEYFFILKRDNYQCQICHGTTCLCIHHKDGNKKNNNPENLIVLCKKCHKIVHLIHLCLSKIFPYDKLCEMAKLILYTNSTL